MKKIIIATFLLCFQLLTYSQKQQIDSLNHLLTNKKDSNQIKILNELSYALRNSKIDLSKKFAEKALKLSKKINYEKGIARSSELIGLIYYRLGFYEKSIEFHFEALKLNEKLNNQISIAWAYNNLANCFIELKNFKLAQKNLQKCLDIQLNIDNKEGIANSYKNFAFLYLAMNQYADAIVFAKKSIKLSDSIHDARILAYAYSYLGDIYQNKTKYDSALLYFFKAANLQQSKNDLYGKAHTFNRIAETYKKNRNFEPALNYYNEAIKISGELNIQYELQAANKGIAEVYYELNDYKSAFLNYKKYSTIKDSLFTTTSIFKISILQSQYENEKNEFQINALKVEQKLQNTQIRQQKIIIYFSLIIIVLFFIFLFLQFRSIKFKKQANYLLTLRNIEMQEKNLLLIQQKDEIIFQNKQLDAQKEKIDEQNNKIIVAYENVAILSEIGKKITSCLSIEKITSTIYEQINVLMDATIFDVGIYNKTINCLEFHGGLEKGIRLTYNAVNLSESSLATVCYKEQEEIIINTNTEFLNIFIATHVREGNRTASLIYLPLTIAGRQIGVITVQSFKENAYTQNEIDFLRNIAIYATIAFENAEIYRDLEIQKNEIIEKNKILEHQKNKIMLINHELNILNEEISTQRDNLEDLNVRLNQKNEEIASQRDNLVELNQDLLQKNEEINTQRDDLELKNNKIEFQNEQIKGSIRYAQKIQQAILPSENMLNEIFPEHFLLWKPLDIVSGDFYYWRYISGMFIIAAADCTGHGVPGAFMSMLGVTLLNEIVLRREITAADEVLNVLRNEIKYALGQTGKIDESTDGMDIALCAIDIDSLEMTFSGAFNSFWYFRNDEFIKIKGDRQPVGVYSSEAPFTEHKIQLQHGDRFYIFSDGYYSQFGGSKPETFRPRRFTEILTEINRLPMELQKDILEKRFNTWQGNNIQTDDVLVIGVKI